MSGDSGWLLTGKMAVALCGLLGLFLTLLTFQASARSERLRRAEEEYRALVADLRSDNEQVRIDALTRVPDVYFCRAPQDSTVTPAESLRILCGLADRGYPIFADSLRRRLSDYATSGASRKVLPAREATELVHALAAIGATGWYLTERSNDPRALRTLAWIWAPPPPGALPSETCVQSIFVGAHVRGLDLSAFQMQSADFRGAIFESVKFDQRADISHATFEGARLTQCDFHAALLCRVNMQDAIVDQCRFDGCAMQGGALSGSRFVDSYFSKVDLSPSVGDSPCVADLSRVVLVDCVISEVLVPHGNLFGLRFATDRDGAVGATACDFGHADLRSSTFDRVTADDTSFEYAQLGRATFRGARLHYAKFRGATLDGVDFSGADLSHARGFEADALHAGTGIESCRNANLAGVSGLDEEQVSALISLGAVVIPDAQEWERYKRESLPHERWRTFTVSP